MAGPFDGVATVLGDVFGDDLVATPAGGGALALRGILRREVVDADYADGRPEAMVVPVLKLRRIDIVLAPGDQVLAGGVTYRVLRVAPPVSPATDAFFAYVLEEVPA